MVEQLNTLLLLKTLWLSTPLGIFLLIVALVVWHRAGRKPNTEKREEVAIKITNQAINKIKELLTESGRLYFRIAVGTGSCASENYSLYLETDKKAGDIKLEVDGVKVLISKKDGAFLNGINVDYISLATGGGFKIDNPNILPQCGCGSLHAN